MEKKFFSLSGFLLGKRRTCDEWLYFDFLLVVEPQRNWVFLGLAEWCFMIMCFEFLVILGV